MALYQWRREYTVGVREIDEQHRRLFDYINLLAEAMDSGKDHQVMREVIRDLVAYVRTHFTFEEELLHQYRYPELARHQAIHAIYTQRVNELDAEFRQEHPPTSDEVLAFLNEWLVKHILGTDRKYTEHLRYFGVE